MRFDVYGRLEIEVIREGSTWTVYRRREGKRQAMPEISLPPDLHVCAIPQYLDDLLHEFAWPGTVIRRID